MMGRDESFSRVLISDVALSVAADFLWISSVLLCSGPPSHYAICICTCNRSFAPRIFSP